MPYRNSYLQRFAQDPTMAPLRFVDRIVSNYVAPQSAALDLFGSDMKTTHLTAQTNYEMQFQEGRLALPIMQARDAEVKQQIPNRYVKAYPMQVPCYPMKDALTVQSFFDKGEFSIEGSWSFKTIEDGLAEKAADALDCYSLLKEFNMVQAIQGLVKSGPDQRSDEAWLNVYRLFDQEQKVTEFDLTAYADRKPGYDPFLTSAMYISQTLGTVANLKMVCLCSEAFYRYILTNNAVYRAYDRWQDGQFRRDLNLTGFEYRDIFFHPYTGVTVTEDGTIHPWIPQGTAFLLPQGVSGMFHTVYAPQATVEAMKKPAEEFYYNYWPMPDDTGFEIKAESNQITFCTRPRSVVKLTIKDYVPEPIEFVPMTPVRPNDRLVNPPTPQVVSAGPNYVSTVAPEGNVVGEAPAQPVEATPAEASAAPSNPPTEKKGAKTTAKDDGPLNPPLAA